MYQFKEVKSEIQKIINNYGCEYGSITMNHPLIIEAVKNGYVRIISATQLEWTEKAHDYFNEEFIEEYNLSVGTQIKVFIPNAVNTYEIRNIFTYADGCVHLKPVGNVSVDLRSIPFSLLKPSINIGQIQVQYKLDDEKLNWITSEVNRSKQQTQMLYNLLRGNFEKLIQLEVKIKNCFINYCPSDLEEIEKIFSLESKSNHYSLNY